LGRGVEGKWGGGGRRRRGKGRGKEKGNGERRERKESKRVRRGQTAPLSQAYLAVAR
jgi:hypothetical protein